MIVWKLIKNRSFAVATGINLLFISLIVIYANFFRIMRAKIEVLYFYYDGVVIRKAETTMPRINDLLQQAGIIPVMIIAFIIACILPVFFILKDYYEMKSIRTIMRLPISKTIYYVDKLLPPVFLLGVFWLMQLNTIYLAERLYLWAVPSEKIPSDALISLWKNPPVNLFYPLQDFSHISAMLSFLILIPATAILFVLAERSKKRGIISGVIACIGIIAIIIYLLDLPSLLWLVPSTTVTVIAIGVWHINRIQIT